MIQQSQEMLELAEALKSISFKGSSKENILAFFQNRDAELTSMFTETIYLMNKTNTLPKRIDYFMVWCAAEIAKTELQEILKKRHPRKRVCQK